MKPEYLYMNLLAPLVIVAPIVFAGMRWGSLAAEAKILFYYLLFEAVISLLSSWLAYQHITNLPLYHIATIPQTLLLGFFFLKIIHGRRATRAIKIAVLFFSIFAIINSIFIQSFQQLNSNALVLQAGLVILFSLFYINRDTTVPGKPWAAIPQNLFVSGLLIYFSSSFILFIFSNLLATHAGKKMLIVTWNIHALLLDVMYALFSLGFSKYKRDET